MRGPFRKTHRDPRHAIVRQTNCTNVNDRPDLNVRLFPPLRVLAATCRREPYRRTLNAMPSNIHTLSPSVQRYKVCNR